MWIPDVRLDTGLLVGAAVAVVAASPVQAADSYVFGVCQVSRSDSGAEIRPLSDGGSYLFNYHGDDPRYKEKLSSGPFFSGAKVTLIKAPSHGELALVDTLLGKSNNWYHYMPKEGYGGRDRFVMQVEKDGVKVRIHYLMEALDEYDTPTGRCKLGHWKVSSTFTTPALDNARLQSFLDATGINDSVAVTTK